MYKCTMGKIKHILHNRCFDKNKNSCATTGRADAYIARSQSYKCSTLVNYKYIYSHTIDDVIFRTTLESWFSNVEPL